MHTRYKIGLGVVAGVLLGAAAMQGLHVQAKPKAFLVTESQIVDAAALPACREQIQRLIQAERKPLAPQREKAFKIVKQFIASPQA